MTSGKEGQSKRQHLIEMQRKYCRENKIPMFACSSGLCRTCGQDIVNKRWETELITGCPKCCRTFVD